MILKVKRRRQERSFYCAPACVQMTLNYYSNCNISQDRIWNSIRVTSSKDNLWHVDPKALSTILRKTCSREIALMKHKTNSAYSIESIVFSINNNYPPTLLVEGGKHWVIACGYQINEKTKEVTNISILDPAKGALEVKHIKIFDFLNNYFRAVDVPGRWFGYFIAITLLNKKIKKLENLEVL